jgi:2-phosphosulfolactate phosphatase
VNFDQADFEIRCEWGLSGLRALGPAADVVIIVDVLSFCTALDVATSRGAAVYPYRFKDAAAAAYAASIPAELASAGRGPGYSLSPASLQSIEAGTRLVLPSPNGAALAFSAEHPIILAACLRNATAAAALAAGLGTSVAVIPAGETWDSGELRPCAEDLAGAGAVISALRGRKSPEALLAEAGYALFRDQPQALRYTGSGKELVERGYAADVDIAAEIDASRNVPRMTHRAFTGIRV